MEMEEINFVKKFSKEQKEEIIKMLCEGLDLQVRSNSKNNFLITLNDEILEDLDLHKIFILSLLKINIKNKDIKEWTDITTGKTYCVINI